MEAPVTSTRSRWDSIEKELTHHPWTKDKWKYLSEALGVNEVYLRRSFLEGRMEFLERAEFFLSEYRREYLIPKKRKKKGKKPDLLPPKLPTRFQGSQIFDVSDVDLIVPTVLPWFPLTREIPLKYRSFSQWTSLSDGVLHKNYGVSDLRLEPKEGVDPDLLPLVIRMWLAALGCTQIKKDRRDAICAFILGSFFSRGWVHRLDPVVDPELDDANDDDFGEDEE